MRFGSVAALVAAGTLVTACANIGGQTVGCTTDDAIATALSVVNDQVEKNVRKNLKREDGTSAAGTAKIRATLKQLKLSIEDVRTSKEDPNSTKKFCTGKLKVVMPDEAVQDADKARELVGDASIDDLADQLNVEKSANSFSTDISYNVQPTDDGEKVYAEIEDGDNIYNFFGQVVASHLARKLIENAQAEQQQAKAEQQRQEEAAAQEQKAATLEEARAENKLAEQSINEIWASIPEETRSSLLELQRAWIKRKTADCKIQAATVSFDPQEKENARLRCEARMNYERGNELRRYSASSGYGM